MPTNKSLLDRFTGKLGGRSCLEALSEQRIVQGNGALAKELCKKHRLAYYKQGDVIIAQDHAGNDLMFLLAGRVTIHRSNRQIAERKAGECVGELALIDATHPRCASVIAAENCVVAVVTEHDFSKVAKKFPDVWRALAKQNANRLRERLQGVRPRNEVSKLFIGSSKESLTVGEAVKSSLAHVAAVTLWTKGVFGPDKFTLEALEDQARNVDFAIMVFGPDDVIFSRHKRQEAPRDNVIFELGLFMGALGRKRAFVIAPAGKKLKIPTDLLGTNRIEYSATDPRELVNQIDAACEDLRDVIVNQGPL